jgi:16S rRNA (uracil1498-N3)-methyltransferase
VQVFDGAGRTVTAELTAGTDPVLAIRTDVDVALPRVPVTLVQALPKGRKMDLIVEKATELGAARIVPTITERAISRPAGRSRAEKQARWQRVASTAARQCGTAHVPEVLPVSSFADALAAASSCSLFLVASLQPDAVPLRDALAPCRQDPPARVAMLIGPEGDLTPGELEMATQAGAVRVSFGSLVLRVETAALYGLSVLAYELGAT